MGIKAIMGAQFGALSLKKTTSTNPFEHNSFKGKSFTGSVLPFADVFQSIKPVEAKPSKMKMVSSAVVGAVSNFKTKLTQPIINFANNVKETVAHGVEAMKSAKNSITEMGKNMHSRIAQMFNWNKVAEDNKENVKILSMRHINNKASVKDLKATWLAENAEIKAKEMNEAGKAVA